MVWDAIIAYSELDFLLFCWCSVDERPRALQININSISPAVKNKQDTDTMCRFWEQSCLWNNWDAV